jgi:hypothetical protein
LADNAEATNVPWLAQLKQASTVSSPDLLRNLVREIAAYRERYNIRNAQAIGPRPAQTAFAQTNHHERLTNLLRDARLTTPPATEPSRGPEQPQTNTPA